MIDHRVQSIVPMSPTAEWLQYLSIIQV